MYQLCDIVWSWSHWKSKSRKSIFLGRKSAGKSFLESNNSLAIWPSVSWLINNHFLAHHLWEQMGLNLKQRLLLVYLDLLHRRRESAPDSHLIFITSDRIHGIQFYHFTLTTFREFLNLKAGRDGAKKWRCLCTGCTTTSQLGTLAYFVYLKFYQNILYWKILKEPLLWNGISFQMSNRMINIFMHHNQAWISY